MLTREKMRVCSGMMTPLAPIRSANEDDPRQGHTQEEDVSMAGAIKKPFNTATFLATKGPGRSISTHAPKQVFFSQGGPADAVFHLQTGRAKRERCERPRPQPLPHVRYSESRRRQYSASCRRNISSPSFS